MGKTDTCLKLLTAVFNVEIHSNINPTPDFETAADFVPWRIGSETHLGIRRCSTLDTTFDPPPYAAGGETVSV